MFEQIISEANRLQPELVEIRRHIHRNPELGFEEWETAKLVSEKISGLGLRVTKGVAKTGILAVLPREGSNRTIALRADMDALPVEEQNDVPYKSVNPGIMHACGHDAHLAMLIGAAKILSFLKDGLKVNVKFIFQPCEEQPKGGAAPMIKAGVLEKPKVDAIFGLHINPYLPAGFLGLKEGIVMAAADEFTIEIKGRGGHGAAPHQTVDPIVVSAYVVQALQLIVSRQTDPLEPVVVSVCAIKGGQSFNIIADRVTLTGTVRTLNPQVQQQMPEAIRNIVKGVTSAFGADFNFDYQWGYPLLRNNQQMLDIVRQAGRAVVGRQKVLQINMPSMGAEDFAYFTGHVPGAYFFLGAQPPGGVSHPWHNPKFDIDEAALATGAAVLAGCVVKAQEVLEGGK
ncbi:MAG: amidohydrolase [Firmicutes bacterium HGW-Firmicutes-8]|nr:MAG: amidohydrolase [Firmicutes bacterium HGW-Firmicutes-8]